MQAIFPNTHKMIYICAHFASHIASHTEKEQEYQGVLQNW